LRLPISKAFVEMLGGKIWVESKTENLYPGSPDNMHGVTGITTFYFTIPVEIKN
jgi:signal transduction histidine kinase